MVKVVYTDKAPKPVGPYSQALIYKDLVFVSGQIPIDPGSGEVVSSNFEVQTRRVLENLKAILEAAGSSMDKVLKVTVYLSDMGLFNTFNKIYSEYFRGNKPARSVVEVSSLPKGVMIEVEAIAHI